MPQQTPDDIFLVHFGRKGMRWGVRNSQSATAGKRIKDMTDAELAANVKRLQLEKTMKQLTAEATGKSRVTKGTALVSKILIDAGSSAATAYATKAISAKLLKLSPIG